MITLSRARAIFVSERRRFAKVYPRLARVSLNTYDADCFLAPCKPRDLAQATDDRDGLRVHLLQRALTSEARVRGLLRHELGHLALHHGGSEQDADDVAEHVTRQKVRYDKDDVQTTGRGTWPRPKHLPR
jgi:hypothetical protein